MHNELVEYALDLVIRDLAGLDKSKPVVVAMSGGCDSSTLAALVKLAGYEVIGVTLDLIDYQSEADANTKITTNTKTCCAGRDLEDARQVARDIGISHHVIDLQERFKESVIRPFVESYGEGLTPVPCILCNQSVKFEDLLGIAQSVEASALLTGHYVKRVLVNNRPTLAKAKDTSKDQSFYLFATTPQQLQFVRFPLGDLLKSEIRQIAQTLGLNIARKSDSQDICFVGQQKYVDIITKMSQEEGSSVGEVKVGEIVTEEGKVIGYHSGVEYFTIGQRKGIGIGGSQTRNSPLYVIDILPKLNRVVVGEKNRLQRHYMLVQPVNLLTTEKYLQEVDELKVQYRSLMTEVDIKLEIVSAPEDDKQMLWKINFMKPQSAVAPGQACVVFHGEYLLGGGWIVSAH